MTDLIDRGSRLGESSLYKDRMLSVVQSGASWPQVERRRGPRRHAEVDPALDRRTPIEPVLQLAVLPELARRGQGADRHLRSYRNSVYAIDVVAAVIGATMAYLVRFGPAAHGSDARYAWGIAVLPLLWLVGVGASRAYESRFLASSTEEYRRVLNAGLGLIAGISVVSYTLKAEFARGYVVTALPVCVAVSM